MESATCGNKFKFAGGVLVVSLCVFFVAITLNV